MRQGHRRSRNKLRLPRSPEASIGNQVSTRLSRICDGRETSSSDFWWDRVVEEARRPLKSANAHNLGLASDL